MLFSLNAENQLGLQAVQDMLSQFLILGLTENDFNLPILLYIKRHI